MSVFGLASNKQITVDGIRLSNPYITNKAQNAYGHFSVKGLIETYSSTFFNPHHEGSPTKLIIRGKIVNAVYQLSKDIIEYYKELAIDTPINLSCAIINGQGYTMPMNSWGDTLGQIDRDLLLVPDFIMDSISVTPETIAKNLLDGIWHACGFSDCPAINSIGQFFELS